MINTLPSTPAGPVFALCVTDPSLVPEPLVFDRMAVFDGLFSRSSSSQDLKASPSGSLVRSAALVI